MNEISKLAQLILDVTPSLMHMVRKEVRLCAKSDLTVPQLRVLAHINHGIHTVGELKELQGVAQPTMTKIINGLMSRGLVTKMRSSQDKRQQELGLTEEGKAKLKKVREKTREAISRNLVGLSSKERVDLIQSFLTIDDLISKKEQNSSLDSSKGID